MRTIKRGDVGADVSTWQQIVQIHADGLFGEATDKATRAWQTAHQLLPDGKVGPRTWEAAGVTPLPNPDPRPRWPAQAECNEFYGDPRNINGGASAVWERQNLVLYHPPWKMIDEDTRDPIRGITIHKKCFDSLGRVFDKAWELYNKSQAEIEKHSLHIFSGSHVFRNIRGRNTLSMHSYGCALDIASSLNGLGEPYDPKHGLPMAFVALFEAERWTWGGRWTGRPDPMHFQAAYVSRSDVPVA